MLASLQSPYPPYFGCVNKAAPLPSGWVMLSVALNQYYEPLRLPIQPDATSFPHTHRFMFSPLLQRVSSTGLFIFRNMPPLLPREIPRTASVIPVRDIGLPLTSTGSASPSLLTRLHTGSLSLRPAASPFVNLRPGITPAPLTRANGATRTIPRAGL